MRLFFAFLLLMCGFLIPSNVSATHYPSARIKNYAMNTPRKVENDVKSLVDYLVKPLDDDYDKVKMIAYWIASHINYDDYLYTDGKSTKLMKRYKVQTPEELLESRSGICLDFALLFTAMCKRTCIGTGHLSGYVYPMHRKRKSTPHIWNYFVYNNKRIYVDTTFMAKGRTRNTTSTRELDHKRALKDIARKNKKKSVVNDFDDFYFDFSYRKERTNRNYSREETGSLVLE